MRRDRSWKRDPVVVAIARCSASDEMERGCKAPNHRKAQRRYRKEPERRAVVAVAGRGGTEPGWESTGDEPDPAGRRRELGDVAEG